MKKSELPKIVIVYVDYERDGTPYLCVAKSIAEIPAENHDFAVGCYELRSKGKLTVTKKIA